MANSKSKKALRKIVEGEHLAANALAVAVGKVKETDLQELLGQIRIGHESNAETAGKQLKELGGKYPIPGLRDQLKKGWEAVASSKTSSDAVKVLHRKERDSLIGYKDLLKKVADERTLSVLLRNMAEVSENVVKLRESLAQLQTKKKGKGRILGLPRLVWLVAVAGAGYLFYKQRASKPGNPTTPKS